MKKYYVIITEYLTKEIEIEAESDVEAIIKVKNKYRNEEIILGAEDHVHTDFDVEEEQNG